MYYCDIHTPVKTTSQNIKKWHKTLYIVVIFCFYPYILIFQNQNPCKIFFLFFVQKISCFLKITFFEIFFYCIFKFIIYFYKYIWYFYCKKSIFINFSNSCILVSRNNIINMDCNCFNISLFTIIFNIYSILMWYLKGFKMKGGLSELKSTYGLALNPVSIFVHRVVERD